MTDPDSMNFTSFHFLGFFFVVLLLGSFLKNRAWRIFLLLTSYYFYGAFEPFYLLLIIGSTVVDYVAALGIEKSRERTERTDGKAGPPWPFAFMTARAWLILSLCMNLGLLAYFKYTNFGIGVLNDLQPMGSSIFAFPAAAILLPVGISFYTFQSMSYTIDVYRGILKARRNITDFALYVAFFPQLVAGPIVRATTFLNRLDDPLPVTREDMIIGMSRIVMGFFRKLVLADNLAALVNPVFDNPMAYHPVDIWLASFGFGFQIYLDFAGYTDIARGIARLFGFEFELNFLYPMAAANITDHWKRWHISLTTWIRDYLFIPLGGSRGSPVRVYFNMFIVWFAVGLWHGASYHFIVWGVWQFVMLSIHRVYSRSRIGHYLNMRGGRFYDIISRLLLLFALNFGFIWFRSPNILSALKMHVRQFGGYDGPASWTALLAAIFSGKPWTDFLSAIKGPVAYVFPSPVFSEYAILLLLYFAFDLIMNRYRMSYFRKRGNENKLVILLTAMAISIIIFSDAGTPEFMYFQF